MTIALAIRAEFERRRRQGQVGVDAGRMNRDAVNRNLFIWRDMVMWAGGDVPVGTIDFSGWATAAMTAAHKTAARLQTAQQASKPLAPSAPRGAALACADGWNTETITHANTLRAAAIKLHSLSVVNAALRAQVQQEKIAA